MKHDVIITNERHKELLKYEEACLKGCIIEKQYSFISGTETITATYYNDAELTQKLREFKDRHTHNSKLRVMSTREFKRYRRQLNNE